MSINQVPFDEFLKTLQITNRSLNFYVDWQKCLENRDRISIALNTLNFLLGKSEDEMLDAIQILYQDFPNAFGALNLLIAVRDKNEKLLDMTNQAVEIKSYFQDPQKIFAFMKESGLLDVFSSRQIKDLNDFVFGIEVGLDVNARKNRSGILMEKYLEQIFEKEHFCFKTQVPIQEFGDLQEGFGSDRKDFDFVIFGEKKTYFIECNFYASGGSKLNEVARSYQEIASKFRDFEKYEFVWITDGYGWLGARSKLEEAYKSVRIFSLSNLEFLFQRIKNG